MFYTDRKHPYCSIDVVSYSDYMPFGMQMAGRHGSAGDYRYGFQGQEKDDEVKGEGNSVNYKYRMHDPRVGRFFARDPISHKYPFYSPYAFSGNRVLDAVEMEGLQPERVTSTANSYKGTPYEYGGKKPAFKGGLPSEISKDFYLEYVGYPSSAIKSKGGKGTRYKNPYYGYSATITVLNATFVFSISKYLVNGATSCGIDCSGLAAVSFNSDEEKLMDNLPLGRAKEQRQAFVNAEEENKGYLSDDFSNITEGDLIFNANATHVMVGTGEVRTINGVTEVQVTHAPETGRYVDTEWKKVGTGYTYGHTFRTSDNVSNTIEVSPAPVTMPSTISGNVSVSSTQQTDVIEP